MPSRESLSRTIYAIAQVLSYHGQVYETCPIGVYMCGGTGIGKSTALLDVCAGVAVTFRGASRFQVVPVYFSRPLFARVKDASRPFDEAPEYIIGPSRAEGMFPVPLPLAILHALESERVLSIRDPSEVPASLRWSSAAFSDWRRGYAQLSDMLRHEGITVLVVVDEFMELFKLSESRTRECKLCLDAAIAALDPPGTSAIAAVVADSSPALYDVLKGQLSPESAKELGFTSFANHDMYIRDKRYVGIRIEPPGSLSDFLWMLEHAKYPYTMPPLFRSVAARLPEADASSLWPFPPRRISKQLEDELLSMRFSLTRERTMGLADLYLETGGVPRLIGLATARGFFEEEMGSDRPSEEAAASRPTRTTVSSFSAMPMSGSQRTQQAAWWNVLHAVAAQLLSQSPDVFTRITSNPFAFRPDGHLVSVRAVSHKLELMWEANPSSSSEFPETFTKEMAYRMSETSLIDIHGDFSSVSFAASPIAYEAMTRLYQAVGGLSKNIHEVMLKPLGTPAQVYGKLMVAASLGQSHPEGHASVLGFLLRTWQHRHESLSDEAAAALSYAAQSQPIRWKQSLSSAGADADILGAAPADLLVLDVNEARSPGEVSVNTLCTVYPDFGVDLLCVLKAPTSKFSFICAIQVKLSAGDSIRPFEKPLEVPDAFCRMFERWNVTQQLVDRLGLDKDNVIHVTMLVTNKDTSACLSGLQRDALKWDTSRWTRAIQEADGNETKAMPIYNRALSAASRGGMTPPGGVSVVAACSEMEPSWAPPVRLAAHDWNLLAYGGKIPDAGKLEALQRCVQGTGLAALMDASALPGRELERRAERELQEAERKAERERQEAGRKAERERQEAQRERQEAERKAERERQKAERERQEAERAKAMAAIEEAREALYAVIPLQFAGVHHALAKNAITPDRLRTLSLRRFAECVAEVAHPEIATRWFEDWQSSV